MEIKALFDEQEDINLYNLLLKSNINDVDKYLKYNTLDKGEDYVNMEEAKELFVRYVNE